MINRLSAGSIFLLLQLLAGCASTIIQPSESSTTPQVIQQQATENAIVGQVPAPVVYINKAVIALVERARLDTGTGKQEAAGSSLERALRIEPRNAWLWNELAQVRLAQGQYAQAISLAQKSNSFAAGDRRLQASNWRVIGNARVAQGNSSSADQAFKRATEFE